MDPRVKEVKDAAKKRNKELLSKAFKEVVGSQLEKVKQQLSSRTSDEQEEIYRRTLERERENALKKRKGKKISAAHQHLATSTGLSGQVVALMGKMESSDSDHDSRDARHKKKKKRKKSDRDKKDKKSKKRRKSEKRSKKHKSSRSSSKYHSDSSEDSYSSCSLKEDNNHSK